MNYVDSFDDLGPADDVLQICLLTAYIQHNVPFLMIGAGHTLHDEMVEIRDSLRRTQIDLSMISNRLFRVVNVDRYIKEKLDINSLNLLAHGRAVVCQGSWHRRPMTQDEHLLQFFSDLLFDDFDTALLPQFAPHLAEFLKGGFDFADNFRLEDDRCWSEMRQALQNAECKTELSGCVDYVLKNKYPILLSFFPKNDGIVDARVVARKIDHWVVQPTILVSVT